MKSKVFYPQVLGVSFICLTGFFFGDPQDEVKDFLQKTESEVKATHKIDLPPMPEIRPYQPFVYTAASDDPFKLQDFVKNAVSPLDLDAEQCESADCGDSPPIAHIPYFLESYDLSQLQMVGTVVDKAKGKRVLIATPNAGIAEAKVGEYIGRDNGLILSIEPDHIVIQEKIKVPRGWQNRMSTLELFN